MKPMENCHLNKNKEANGCPRIFADEFSDNGPILKTKLKLFKELAQVSKALIHSGQRIASKSAKINFGHCFPMFSPGLWDQRILPQGKDCYEGD